MCHVYEHCGCIALCSTISSTSVPTTLSSEAACPTIQLISESLTDAEMAAAFADDLLFDIALDLDMGDADFEDMKQWFTDLQRAKNAVASLGRDTRDILVRLDLASWTALEMDMILCGRLQALFGWEVMQLLPFRTCRDHHSL
ncbi:hypothetical protein F5Y03DRAFT_367044 [Xylaria venustula]|nr:hypothetical protein F5Y03DRAFT_367044 [Xylaria venustula]